MRRISLLTVFLCLLAMPLLAQAPVLCAVATSAQKAGCLNPTGVTFTSPDHAAMDAAGQPVVVKYQVEIDTSAGAMVGSLIEIGKPTADAAGVIDSGGLTPLTALADGTYTVKVIAVGQPNTIPAVSVASDPFVRVRPRTPAAPGKPVVR